MSILNHLLPGQFKTWLKEKLGVPSQEKSFKNLKRLGYNAKVVLDIGAYEGIWTEGFKTIFPDAKVLMIEGQSEKEEKLQQVIQRQPGTAYKIKLLGSEEKTVDFNKYETASSVLNEDNETNAKVEKRTLRLLDDVVKNTGFEQPDFIKVDTQGYELEILKGGLNTLKHAQVVLLEVSLLPIYNNCPLAFDVVNFMQQQDFVLYDICTLMYRPYDKALYQTDFLFVKAGSDLRASTRWI